MREYNNFLKSKLLKSFLPLNQKLYLHVFVVNFSLSLDLQNNSNFSYEKAIKIK